MQTDTLAPCHICGERPRVIGDARGMLGDNAWKVTCHPATAIYPTRAEAVAAWNDDARAREVLRACEVLDRQREVRTVQVATQGCSAQAERGRVWKYADGATFADALIVLAGEVTR